MTTTASILAGLSLPVFLTTFIIILFLMYRKKQK